MKESKYAIKTKTGIFRTETDEFVLVMKNDQARLDLIKILENMQPIEDESKQRKLAFFPDNLNEDYMYKFLEHGKNISI